MPRAVDLPEALKELANRNSLEVNDAHFRTDIDRLIEALIAPSSERLADTVFVGPEQPASGGFVGRDREIADLKAALEDAMAGRGRLVFITGEAGIGKTRLAAELRDYAQSLGFQWLEGRYEKEGSIPLQPNAEAVRTYLRVVPQGSLATVAGPYATEIARAFPVIATDLETAPPPIDSESRCRANRQGFNGV